MKVFENNADRMVLGNRPLLQACGLGALAFIAVFAGHGLVGNGEEAGMFVMLGGPLFLLLVGAKILRKDSMLLDRHDNCVEIRSVGLFGTQHQIYRLSDLRHARLEARETRQSDDDGSTRFETVYRPVLVMQDEEVPVITSFSNGYGSRALVAEINGWLGVDAVEGEAVAA